MVLVLGGFWGFVLGWGLRLWFVWVCGVLARFGVVCFRMLWVLGCVDLVWFCIWCGYGCGVCWFCFGLDFIGDYLY